MSADDLIKESLLPRRYQEEIFSRAQQGNVIAAMDTGSGKTLVSLLLIKWISSQEKSIGKLIAFLVPKVALVEQQYAFILNNSSLRVAKFHGALDLDLSDRIGWKERLEGCDVVVMTAQVFLNILTHSLWALDKVSLMIFDECHHARKNHPYNGVLREYFHSPTHLRPKIFGMTASPIWNVKDPRGSLASLEKNLDAKVTAVRDHVQELVAHSPKATELVRVYSRPPAEYDFPSPTLFQCLKVIDIQLWNQLDIPWANIENRYLVTLNDLGPYCASLFLYQEIHYHACRVIVENKQSIVAKLDDVMAMEGILPVPPSCSTPFPDDFSLLADILYEYTDIFPTGTSGLPLSTHVPLAWCTPKVKLLVDILCAFLTGQGTNSDGISKQTDRTHGDPVKRFRDRQINILVATSVAEEGLDFKECDLVVRFDPLQHMVGYVQSRGRARKDGSTYVVMIQENDTAQLEKYHALKQKEPEVNRVYQTRHMDIDDDESGSDDETDPVDMMARERYVVPSTGAVLNYDNSLNLLNYLCSLIPCDAFTTAHVPKYGGDFQATVQLPRALPLSPEDLFFSGPIRRSKREARRAVAFKAVKRLKELDVFDEYLLPMAKHSEDGESIGKTHRPQKTKRPEIPVIMNVLIRDPWCIGNKLWIHPIVIGERLVAGLVTGTPLHPEEITIAGQPVKTLPAKLLTFEKDDEYDQRAVMHEFTKLGIWYTITSRPLTSSLSLYLVPVTAALLPDFHAMELLLSNPHGISDWSQVSEEDYEKLVVISVNHWGSIHLLRRIRHDLSPMSVPTPGSREAAGATYYEYWMAKWARKKRPALVPCDGPLLEALRRPRSNMGAYSMDHTSANTVMVSVPDGRLLPLRKCNWLPISSSILDAFDVLPVLCRRMTDCYRAQSARFELGLPAITTNLIIEAFTIPSATMPFNNQRMETLGDAVLQLCTTVHLLNKYPNRHEGQLSNLRQRYVQNQFLLRRALDLAFGRFVNSEIPSIFKYRYVLQSPLYTDSIIPQRYYNSAYPRRSLQDCMEAILGASFLAGSIPLSLQTGTALGLEFGGSLPWFMRYSQNIEPTTIAPLFSSLEKDLGYKFRYNHLLLESLSHPSCTNSNVPSYQRLEFLGDAILDLVVIYYLFRKFPDATSHQLALPRTKAICSPSLAYLAVRKLALHKVMLSNSINLTTAIDFYSPLLENLSGKEIVKNGWKYDPPKALSDVFESVIGAVLVDSGYDYEKTASVVEHVMSDVLEALSPAVDKDPVSELLEWTAVSARKKNKTYDMVEQEGIAVTVHGTMIVGPIVSASLTVAKFAAAERALTVLKDPMSENSLLCLCDCAFTMKVMLPPIANLQQCTENNFPQDNASDEEDEAMEVQT
ncbi:Endoribonuclease Dicer-like protein 3a [Psilocybe cubensis]|uniref:Endoribonuclease Dicer-like protein 3a n=1 Tax=Psilocybe cubensis TaxID=181762 RepID=A0ACB8H817_PSICU|nr:Endoribonuclease Dicer-like protein 3a [Psilocybe cubensis]KAH9484058.1 Endoribonuclease Dicer-like protein 3a [Psilocybe cubensis]